MLVVGLLLTVTAAMAQQVTGQVTDKDGYAIPYASITYRGHHIAVSSDIEGRFSIAAHPGWSLTVTSVGFKSKTVKVEANTTDLGRIELAEDTRSLNEVVVKSKKGKYSRKDNPAVELMRRVIAAKKRTDLSNHDFYQYNRYQKITLSLNNVTDEQLKSKFFEKRAYLRDQVEVSPACLSARPSRGVALQQETHPAGERRRDRVAARLPQGSAQ